MHERTLSTSTTPAQSGVQVQSSQSVANHPHHSHPLQHHQLHPTTMDTRDEEILDLKQKLVAMMKENNEMKELILFLDDERNYARQFMRDFNSKQSVNWNSLKQKMTFLEQKQFELIRENFSLKQLCVLLDENANSPQIYCHHEKSGVLSSNSSTLPNTRSLNSLVQYIHQLENDVRHLRGTTPIRPKVVNETIKLNNLRESVEGASAEERSILDNLSETAMKALLNR